MNENHDKFTALIKYSITHGLLEDFMKINIKVPEYIEINHVTRCTVSNDNNQVLINF